MRIQSVSLSPIAREAKERRKKRKMHSASDTDCYYILCCVRSCSANRYRDHHFASDSLERLQRCHNLSADSERTHKHTHTSIGRELSTQKIHFAQMVGRKSSHTHTHTLRRTQYFAVFILAWHKPGRRKRKINKIATNDGRTRTVGQTNDSEHLNYYSWDYYDCYYCAVVITNNNRLSVRFCVAL